MEVTKTVAFGNIGNLGKVSSEPGSSDWSYILALLWQRLTILESTRPVAWWMGVFFLWESQLNRVSSAWGQLDWRPSSWCVGFFFTGGQYLRFQVAIFIKITHFFNKKHLLPGTVLVNKLDKILSFDVKGDNWGQCLPKHYVCFGIPSMVIEILCWEKISYFLMLWNCWVSRDLDVELLRTS